MAEVIAFGAILILIAWEQGQINQLKKDTIMAAKTRAEFDQHLAALIGGIQGLLDAIKNQQSATPPEDFSAEDQQVQDAATKVQDTLSKMGPPPVTAGNTIPAQPVSDQNPTPAIQVQSGAGNVAGSVTVPQAPTGVSVVPPPANPQPTDQPTPVVAEQPVVAQAQPPASTDSVQAGQPVPPETGPTDTTPVQTEATPTPVIS